LRPTFAARLIGSVFLITIVTGPGPTFAATADPAPASRRPPNVVFILADDLGYANLGCYGATKINTPHIDQLARDGMRFTQFYAGGAVCAPSRCVLMTGLHTGHSAIRKNGGGNPLRPQDVTIAEVLKSAPTPYAVGGFGKWGLGTEDTTGAPTKQGFDEFFGYLHQVHAHFFYPYWLWDTDAAGMRRFMLPENVGRKQATYSHDVILGRGLEFIRKNKDKPFFCYLPVTLPHVELTVPDDSLAPYKGKFPVRAIADNRKGYLGAADGFATYAGMVSRLDDDVGKVVALLKELGLEDDTLVVFTSDNGPQAGQWKQVVAFFQSAGPFRGNKDTLYQGGLRVPFVAKWPGRIKAGTTNDAALMFQDVLPTFADLSGGKSPASVDGVSFASALLTGKQDKPHDFLYWEHYKGPGRDASMTQAVRAGDWKIVQNKPGAPFELYDLAKDVGEKTDVASAHPDVVDRLKAIAAAQHTPPRKDPGAGKPVGIDDFVR
jgi:arylsulfatase